MPVDNTLINTVARQYDWLCEQGHEHTAAIDQLKRTGDAKIISLLDKFDTVRQGGTSKDAFLRQQIGGLTKVIDAMGDAPGGGISGYMTALSLKTNMDQQAAKIRTHLMSKFTYLGLLSVCGFWLSLIYELYIAPQLAAMFGTFNREAPSAIGMISSLGLFGYPLIFLVLSLATLGIYLFIINSSYHLVDGKNFARPLHWVPGVAKLNQAVHRYLFIGVQHICARNGLNVVDGLKIAQKHVSYTDNDTQEALALAWELDTLEKEFSYQRNAAYEQVESALYVSMRVITTMLTAIMFVLLATLIVNSYIPILNMGRFIV